MGCNKADKDDLWSVLGHSGGERYHQLTMDEMPRHKHAGDPNLSFHVGLAGKGEALQGTEDNAVRALGQGPKYGNTADYDIAVKFDTLQQVRQAQEVYRGGDNAHNNIQPSLAVNFIIKAK
jgi:microcystin-dependent protein